MEEGPLFYRDAKRLAGLLVESGKFANSTPIIEKVKATCNEALYAYSLPQKEEILTLLKEVLNSH